VVSGHSKVFAALALTSVLGAPTWAQEAPKKEFKDRAEYDLFEASRTGKDPKKSLEALNQWKEKYPATDYKIERLTMYLSTYQQLNQGENMWNAGKDLLAEDPSNITGLYWMTLLGMSLGRTEPDRLGTGEKASNGFIGSLDTTFAPDKRPPNMSESDWKTQRNNMEAAARTTLGWIAMNRKNPKLAEEEFIKSLKLNQGNGQVSTWLGGVIRDQKDPDKQSAILFHFARAAHYDGPGALSPVDRQKWQAFFEKAFVTFHGDKSGIEDVIKVAKSTAVPDKYPEIENINVILNRKEEEFKKTNPMLALWLSVKKELSGDNGPEYFKTIKDALMPGGANDVKKFKARIVSTKPEARPKEVVVAISPGDAAEATLRLDAPMAGKADPGTEIEFEGVAVEYTREPFNLTFDVEKDNVTGWPAPPKPAPKTSGKKGAKKK